MNESNEWRLVGSKCHACGKVSFPEKVVCPSCLDYQGHDRVLIGKGGEIKNFTVGHVAPAGFTAPYIMAFVRLAEGPEVFSIIEGGLETAEKIELGQKVKLVVEQVTEDGVNTARWKYALAK